MAKLRILAHLHRNGDLTPGDLAAADGVRPQSLTRTLADLEADGLIVRRRDPRDGRQAMLTITGRGTMALSADMRVRDRWLAAAMERRLSPAERHVLYLAGELMDRLATAE